MGHLHFAKDISDMVTKRFRAYGKPIGYTSVATALSDQFEYFLFTGSEVINDNDFCLIRWNSETNQPAIDY
jgi:hypothetical protein